MLQRTVMWNVVDNFDVKCSGERLREIWWITLVWNMVENFDVECSREWLRGMLQRTVT